MPDIATKNPQYVPGHGLLAGKGVLITAAAGSGIGSSTARKCIEEGARVVISDKHERRLAETAAELGVIGIPCDVTNEESVQNLIAQAAKELGAIDVLVNNAGISPYATFAETSLEDWHRIMRINLDSAFLLTQAFLDDLIMSGSGRVVNLTSSVVWDFQAKDMTAYTTSKAGIVGLTRALASELGIHGVTVNCIAPGIVLTSNIKERVSTERLEEYRERQSIKTLARPTDLVSALNFLVSEDSCQVTGIVVPVNGGRVAL